MEVELTALDGCIDIDLTELDGRERKKENSFRTTLLLALVVCSDTTGIASDGTGCCCSCVGCVQLLVFAYRGVVVLELLALPLLRTVLAAVVMLSL